MLRCLSSIVCILFFLPVGLVAQKPQSYILPLQSILFSQKSNTPTVTKELQPFDSQSFQKMPSRFKNIPKDLTEKLIKYLDFDPHLAFSNADDSSPLCAGKVNHYLFFLIGKNSAGKKIIIIDTNNNQDFGDDRMYVLDPEVDEDKTLDVIAKVEYCVNKKIFKKHINLKIWPFSGYDKNKTRLENELALFISSGEHKYGIMDLGNSKISVSIDYPVSYLIDPPESWKISFKSVGKSGHPPINFDCYYSDTVSINGDFYKMKISTPSADSLILMKLDLQHTPTGVIAGMSAFAVLGQDYISGNEINSKASLGKYLLLDFWGSWCVPCIQSLPDLKALKAHFKDKLEIISIAVDNEGNLPKLKKIISDSSMRWQHILDPFSAKNSIFKHYRISAFPTYILIDPEGKIILKTEDDNYKNINQICKDIIKGS